MRDNHQCFICNSPDNLVVHHIWYVKGHSEFKLEFNNLITVCKKCHYRIHKLNDTFKLLDMLQRYRFDQYSWILSKIS